MTQGSRCSTAWRSLIGSAWKAWELESMPDTAKAETLPGSCHQCHCFGILPGRLGAWPQLEVSETLATRTRQFESTIYLSLQIISPLHYSCIHFLIIIITPICFATRIQVNCFSCFSYKLIKFQENSHCGSSYSSHPPENGYLQLQDRLYKHKMINSTYISSLNTQLDSNSVIPFYTIGFLNVWKPS